MTQISGFQRLRYVDVLKVTNHPNLVSIDGFAGIESIRRHLDVRNNPQLCYILSDTPDYDYWKVSGISHYSTLYE